MNPKPKGKLYPSSTSEPSLIPAAFIALAAALTAEDREVLAFMISRSISSTVADHTSRCGCFDCYTTYWHRWDSSPHSELIHQAIEAFEQNLCNPTLRKKNRSKPRKKKRFLNPPSPPHSISIPASDTQPCHGGGDGVLSPDAGGLKVAGGENRVIKRMVLPEVVSLWSSRLWRLWNPGV